MNVISKKLFLFLLMILLLAPTLVNAEENRRVFMCSNCQMIIPAEKMPSSLGCTKANYHIWANLGVVGLNVFNCKKCNVIVYTKLIPNAAYTKEHGYHYWIRLGEFGEKVFNCKKCGVSARLKQRPGSSQCPKVKSGYHEWFGY